MSLVEILHRAHKDRLKRMGVPVRHIPIIDVVEIVKIPVDKCKPSVIQISEGEASAFDLVNISTVVRLHKLLKEIAASHKCSVEDMKSMSKFKTIVKARQAYCYRACLETTASLARISSLINRDHSTVISSVARYCSDFNKPNPRGEAWIGPQKRLEREERVTKQRQEYRVKLLELGEMNALDR